MRNSILLIVLILFFSSCGKRNFFPDEDDQGLSRLTFHGYNIATAYINDVPYINPYDRSIFGGGGNEQPVVRRIITNSNFDTLSVSWRIERNDVSDMSLSSFSNISLLMPISKSFTIHDFIALAGKRFSSNTNTVILNSNEDFGLANLYFIKITDDGKYLTFSGLFDGHMANGILITKGRFDFRISVNSINF
ncbi:MAG: hypothetical protein ACTHOB_02530 [Ginsengibacter sp.]